MEHTSEQLAKAFSGLPEDVKEAIAELDLAGALGEIGLKHHLHLDHLGLLADRTALVMMGLEPLATYGGDVARDLGLAPDVAAAITADVNNMIFAKIQESLKKLHFVPPPPVAPGPAAAKAPASQAGVFEEKMSKLFRLPREEVDLPDPYRESTDPHVK